MERRKENSVHFMYLSTVVFSCNNLFKQKSLRKKWNHTLDCNTLIQIHNFIYSKNYFWILWTLRRVIYDTLKIKYESQILSVITIWSVIAAFITYRSYFDETGMCKYCYHNITSKGDQSKNVSDDFVHTVFVHHLNWTERRLSMSRGKNDFFVWKFDCFFV